MADQQQPPPSSSNPSGSQEPTTQPDSAGQSDSAIKPDPDQDAIEDQDIDMAETKAAQDSIPDGENPAATIPTDVDPLAAAPTPSKKETSLREFLGKMDDYAPIVRCLSVSSSLPPFTPSILPLILTLMTIPDPRRGNSPLPHPSRPPTTRQRTQPNPTTPGTSPRAGNPEIRLRHRCRLVSVRPHPRLQQLLRQ
jgi:hypothetical protein